MHKTEKECPICGDNFKQRVSYYKTCGKKECKRKWVCHRAEVRREEKHGKLILMAFNCRECGEEFQQKRRERKEYKTSGRTGTAKWFCSHKCASKWTTDRKTQEQKDRLNKHSRETRQTDEGQKKIRERKKIARENLTDVHIKTLIRMENQKNGLKIPSAELPQFLIEMKREEILFARKAEEIKKNG